MKRRVYSTGTAVSGRLGVGGAYMTSHRYPVRSLVHRRFRRITSTEPTEQSRTEPSRGHSITGSVQFSLRAAALVVVILVYCCCLLLWFGAAGFWALTRCEDVQSCGFDEETLQLPSFTHVGEHFITPLYYPIIYWHHFQCISVCNENKVNKLQKHWINKGSVRGEDLHRNC